MNQYIAGNLIEMTAAFATIATPPVPADPTTVVFRITTPDGTVTDYSGTVSRTGVGAYYAQFNPSQYGLHLYEFIGTGAVQAASIGQFLVSQVTF